MRNRDETLRHRWTLEEAAAARQKKLEELRLKAERIT